MRRLAASIALLAVSAAEPLIEAPPGTRIGLVVATLDGREIVAIRADERFVPASNTKLFTTIAAFETLDLSAPDAAGGASVRLEGQDVVLSGHGDARLSSAPDCAANCLKTLADAVAAKTRHVRDVIGDDSAFADERWSEGMSWNNIPSRSGTAASALTLDDNEAVLVVTPTRVGTAPRVADDGYYTIDNRAVTVAGSRTSLSLERAPNSRALRLTGSIAADAPPAQARGGIDDPAHRAAWRFAALLRDRGVRVSGTIGTRHRLPGASDRAGAVVMRVPPPAPLARLVPPPLLPDVTLTNKMSQNLHAELLLRRIGAARGGASVASVASGLAGVEAVAAKAGVPRTGWDLADGSGMSSYNRVSQRTMVTLLRWAAGRPWGAQFRATLPVAGVDGTLRGRFRGTPLEGRLWAKTGTLNAANALAGYMTAKSGATLVFAAYANDMPADASATAVIDAALVEVAAAN